MDGLPHKHWVWRQSQRWVYCFQLGGRPFSPQPASEASPPYSCTALLCSALLCVHTHSLTHTPDRACLCVVSALHSSLLSSFLIFEVFFLQSCSERGRIGSTLSFFFPSLVCRYSSSFSFSFFTDTAEVRERGRERGRERQKVGVREKERRGGRKKRENQRNIQLSLIGQFSFPATPWHRCVF